MGFAADYLEQLARFARRVPALPRVRALHLPADPPPGGSGTRGAFCALELDDGSLGSSYVLLDDTLARLHGADAALGLAGADAFEVARHFVGADPALRTIGFAAANAMTRCLFDRAGWQPDASADSLGALDAKPGEHVGMIGLFSPLLQRVLASGARLTVVELQPQLAGERDGYRVTLDAAALRACDKVLATGTLVLNDSLDRMLALCERARWIAMLGPSMGCLPDALFSRGVSLVGGSWVLDGPAYVDALRCGAMRSAAARKMTISARHYPGFEALLTRL